MMTVKLELKGEDIFADYLLYQRKKIYMVLTCETVCILLI